MTVHAGYDSIGSSCLGHAQPGTRALQDALIAKWGSTSDGIYNCRNVRGGSTKSAHAEGRAVDYHWTNQASGQQIANALVALNDKLGIQVVIWWDHIWSFPHADEGFRPYHGADPHHTHIHAEQNWSGATELTLPEANRVLNPSQDVTLAATGDPIPLPTEDDVPFVITNEDNKFSFLIDGGRRRRIDGPDRPDGDTTLAECRHLFTDKGKASTRLIVAISDPDRDDD